MSSHTRITVFGVDPARRRHRILLRLDEHAEIESDTIVELDVPERQMPPGTLVGAMKLVGQAMGAIAPASPEVIAERTAICSACEHHDLGRCRDCGCYLWSKVRCAGERCSLRTPKW